MKRPQRDFLTLESDLGIEPLNAPRRTFAEWYAVDRVRNPTIQSTRSTEGQYQDYMRAQDAEKARKAEEEKRKAAAKLQESMFQHYSPIRGWSGEEAPMKERLEDALGLSLPPRRAGRAYGYITQAQARLRSGGFRPRYGRGTDSAMARIVTALELSDEYYYDENLDGWFKKITGAITGAAKAVAKPIAKAVKVTAKAVKPVAKAVAKPVASAAKSAAKGFTQYVEDSWSVKNWNTPGKAVKMLASGGSWETLSSTGRLQGVIQSASPYAAVVKRIAQGAAQATAAYVSAKEGGDTKTSAMLGLLAGKPTGKFGEALEAMPLFVGKPAVMERNGETLTVTTQGSDGTQIESGFNLSQLPPEARALPNGVPIPGDAMADSLRSAQFGGAMAPVAGANDETASADSPSIGGIVFKEVAPTTLLILGGAALLFFALKPRRS